jgi:hypothetical protein
MSKMNNKKRTGEVEVQNLYAIYDKLNDLFFDGKLPRDGVKFRLEVNSRSYGGFIPNAVIDIEGKSYIHEIVLNPERVKTATPDDLAIFVHQMCHYWQFLQDEKTEHYHNKVWANKMLEIGIIPMSVEEGEYKTTGMTIRKNFPIPNGNFVEKVREHQKELDFSFLSLGRPASKAPNENTRVKYSCPNPKCEQKLSLYCVPNKKINCGSCNILMVQS